MLLLLTIGIAFIYSAGHSTEGTSTLLYRKQLLWTSIGIVFFIGFAMTDYHQWTRVAWWLYGIGLVLLMIVLVPQLGYKIYGARRWLQIAGVRIVQPAELMKIATILVIARLFGWPGRNVTQPRYIFIALGIIIIPMLLIMKQPDMGTAMIFLPTLLILMFISGVRLRMLAILVASALAVSAIVIGIILLPPKLGWTEAQQTKAVKLIGIAPYQRDRIAVFFDSDLDPLGAGWNKAQSQIAVGSGRLWGKGYLKGTQNILGFLPRRVAPNDFIFSIIAEEKGFAGAITVLILFMIILFSGMSAAFRARDRMGRLICVGMIAVLFSHIVINVAMTIGLFPITGTPLPLLSYGGTFMLSTMSALGIIQSVYIRRDWK
jgi:rod shape determining protein RodA